jgi:hypothetical protein
MDQKIIEIIEKIKNNDYLNLYNENIDYECVKAICEDLKFNSTLKVLEFNGLIYFLF